MRLTRIIPLTAVLLATASVTGCDRMVLDSEPGTRPVEIFETIWSDIDRNYSYFTIKEVDWNEVYHEHKSRVVQTQNSDELFYELSAMLDRLQDIHVNLYVNTTLYYSYVNSSNYPAYPQNYNPSIVSETYLESEQVVGPYRYGLIRDTNIGYLRIQSFGAVVAQYRLTDLMAQFQSTERLIIDVRDNGGGSDSMSRFVAGHFTTRDLPYALVRWKSGKGHDEFTAWNTETVSPATSAPYLKPVIVLTNRGCLSSTEDFVLSMRELSQVTVVGDTTGGGSGNPVHRELPNGWTYRFSHWQMATLEKHIFEGTGLEPDLPVWITEEDSLAGRDTILDRAIDLL